MLVTLLSALEIARRAGGRVVGDDGAIVDAWAFDSRVLGDGACFVALRGARVTTGDVMMALVYFVPFFPLFLAWGRARIEWEAYVETIRATAEVHGIAAARALENDIVRRYVGPDYGWMWPFPRAIRRWFAEAIADLDAEGRT